MERAIILVCLLLSLASCAVESKADIEFPEAMRQLSEGFAVLRQSAPAKGAPHLGLLPSECVVTLELAKTAEGKVGIDLSAGGTVIKEITKLDITGSHTQAVARKNTIQLTFKNIYLDKDGVYRPLPGKDGLSGGATILSQPPILLQPR